MKKKISLLIIAAMIFTGCQNAPDTSAETPEQNNIEITENDTFELPNSFAPSNYDLEQVYADLELTEPLAVVYDGVGKLNIVERGGRIISVSEAESEDEGILINMTSVVDTSGQEMGLLGLDFHPDYQNNGYFYVNYTKEGKTFISRFEKTADTPADLNTEKVILTYDQPYQNHNGGTLKFGNDGYLYISSGDGGSGGDPQGNAQNLSSYLGKILRIDVDTEDEPYVIPEDNPFINTENSLAEIYAYGLRNPWKFSFDEGRNILIAADVGQGEIEEIDIIEKGKNYGWNVWEGTTRYSSQTELDEHIFPIYEYPHSEGRSITGGYTYYGTESPGLTGVYIYGDFISGKIWGLWINNDLSVENHELIDTDIMISSFGTDATGEIIVVDFDGNLYKLIETN